MGTPEEKPVPKPVYQHLNQLQKKSPKQRSQSLNLKQNKKLHQKNDHAWRGTVIVFNRPNGFPPTSTGVAPTSSLASRVGLVCSGGKDPQLQQERCLAYTQTDILIVRTISKMGGLKSRSTGNARLSRTA